MIIRSGNRSFNTTTRLTTQIFLVAKSCRHLLFGTEIYGHAKQLRCDTGGRCEMLNPLDFGNTNGWGLLAWPFFFGNCTLYVINKLPLYMRFGMVWNYDYRLEKVFSVD
ncbi:hypothetical protein BRADI_4g20295v3 [Brachypodium distachyon]|uniref:Uncharacterized protein n=1 Tax=Brachypodium distachyon TaxID=15368 RepID=A0A2K2CNU3_BRADI|nr:hypothetical protein BRADI_4g20295v3 [Brachypodium distachyon]